MNWGSKSQVSKKKFWKILDQREQTKLQKLQDSNEITGDNLNNLNMNPADISGTKWKNDWKKNIKRLQNPVRTRILETCKEE